MICRVGNGWHEEEHDQTIGTAAAPGIYTIDIDLDKPGHIKSIFATMREANVGFNNFMCRFAVSLPVPGAFLFGIYTSRVSISIWQLGAAAQNVDFSWTVLVED